MADPFDFSEPTERATTPMPTGPARPPAGHPRPVVPSTSPDPWAVGATSSPFGDAPPFGQTTTIRPLVTARPPIGLLAAAAAAAAIAAAAALLLRTQPVITVLAWVVAGPVAFGLIGAYTAVDSRRRAAAVYGSPGWLSTAYWVVAAVLLAAVVICAIALAQWAARL